MTTSRRQPLYMLVGLAAGAAGGVTANLLAGDSARLTWWIDHLSEPVGKIFLRLLLMLVIPLLVSAIAVSIGEMNLKSLGRIGLTTLIYTVVLSSTAVLLGVGLVNLFRPGEGVSAAVAGALSAQVPTAPAAAGVASLVALVPDNIVAAMAEGNVIGVILFAILFGVGLSLTPTDGALRLREALQGLFDVSMRLIHIVIYLAPVGVGALVFTATARLGFHLLVDLAAYVGVVLLALAIHQFGVYSLMVWLLGGMRPLDFFRKIRAAMIMAFSTASSNATLPTALEVADQELCLPRSVSRFVLTAGATMNQNGTALFEGVTVLFLAQLAGVDLALSQQIVVVIICILGGIGTAGVPAGSIPVVMLILGAIGVPPDGIALVLGVDRFLDMCRTTLNVTGDLAAAVVISRASGEAATASVSE